MGVFKVLGKVAGVVAEGILDQYNETYKKSTGIDLKKEFKPYVDGFREAKKERDELIKAKESYVAEYGQDAYEEEVEYCTSNMADAMQDIFYTGTECANATKDVYRNKVGQWNDGMFVVTYQKRTTLPEWQQKILEEELDIRTRQYESQVRSWENKKILFAYKSRSSVCSYKRKVIENEYERRGLQYIQV